MNLVPPSHICGINLTRAARNDRDRWVASLPSNMKPERIGALLGISRNAVVRAYPLRAAPKIPVAILPPATTAAVSLPQVPGVEIIRARPETDPRAGIVSPKHDEKADDDRPATLEFFMGYLRSLHAQVTAAAEGEA